MTKNTKIQFRATTEELAAWKAAFGERKLSNAIRDYLNAVVSNARRKATDDA